MSVNVTEVFDPNEGEWKTEEIVALIVPILYAFIIIVGVTGNFLVLAVFALNQSMQNTTNVLIINLATADLCFLIFCVPFTAVQYSVSDWPFGSVWCKINMFLQYTSALGSVWTLAFMAFERFIAVAYPVKALKIRTIRNFLRACLIIWLIIFATQGHIFVTHGIHMYNYLGKNRSACIYLPGMEPNKTFEFRAFYWSFNFLAFIIPLGFVYALYSCMIHRLWSGALIRTLSQSSIKTKRRITKMIAFVALTFSICWLPANIMMFWGGVVYPNKLISTNTMLVFHLSSQVLSYTNSCLNPILYGLLSTNFRMGFENAIAWFFRREPKHRLTRQDSSKTKGSSVKRNSKRWSLKAPQSLRRKFTESKRKSSKNEEQRKVPPALGDIKKRLSQQAFDALPVREAQKHASMKQVKFGRGSRELDLDSDDGSGSPHEMDRLFDRDRRDSSRFTASTVTNADSGIGSVLSGSDLGDSHPSNDLPTETELCIRNNFFFPSKKLEPPSQNILGNIDEDREEDVSHIADETTIMLHSETPALKDTEITYKELVCYSATV